MTEFHKDKPAGPRFDGGELEEAVGSTRVNGGRVMFLSPNFSPNFSHKKPTPNRRLIALASGQLRARKLPVARNFPRPPYALMAQRFPPWLAHACPPPYCQRAQIWAGCSRIGSSSRIQEARARMIEDMAVRNLSPATQQSYLNAVSKFSRYFGRSPDRLDLEDVHAFQVHLVATGISWPALNQIVCALRFFYGVTLGQDTVPERITYARQPSKLPVVLSTDEVVRFLEAIPSLKSRAALTTVYAAGLRVSEVVLLKIADIDSQRMVIRVEQGKGGKDRYVMLSPQLLRILRTYWRLARPKRWLFPGRDDERPLVPNVLHAACRSACAAAGLSKQVTVHTLRHTFATHLLESGADVRIIQVLLGHASLASTARYTRVATKTISNTPSPLDRLRLEVVPPG